MKKPQLSKIVQDAFPLLERAVYVRSYASDIPLVPDTTFDIFMTEAGDIVSLVSTDYVDLEKQSDELSGASGKYKFYFTTIFSLKMSLVDVKVAKFAPEESFIKDGNTYYYLANITGNTD